MAGLLDRIARYKTETKAISNIKTTDDSHNAVLGGRGQFNYSNVFLQTNKNKCSETSNEAWFVL